MTLPSSPVPWLRPFVDLMNDTLDEVTAEVPVVNEGRRIHLLYLTAYMRVPALFAAARAVVSVGLTHEVLLLGRPLYEDALRLHHLAQLDQADRDGQIAHWYNHSLIEDEGLFRTPGPPGGRDPAEVIAKKQRTRAEFATYLTNHKIIMSRIPDPTALVQLYADPGTAWVWKLSQQMVHGHNQAHSYRFGTDGENGYSYKLRPAPVEEMQLPVAWVCRSLITARAAMPTILGWPSIGDLMARTVDAIVAVNGATADDTGTGPDRGFDLTQ